MYQYFAIFVLLPLVVCTKQDCFKRRQPATFISNLITELLDPGTEVCQKLKAEDKDHTKVVKCIDNLLETTDAECAKKVPSRAQGLWVNCYLDKLGIKNKPTEELTFQFFKAHAIKLAEDSQKKIVETTIEKCAKDPEFWYCGLKKLYEDVPCPRLKVLYDEMHHWKTGKK